MSHGIKIQAHMWAFISWAGPCALCTQQVEPQITKIHTFIITLAITLIKGPFGKNLISFGKNLILLFNLFLLLFISFTVLFSTIHRSHFTISINFSTFKKKKLSFNKITILII